jgi:cytoskeletal protein CcmA (bactofilin family)
MGMFDSKNNKKTASEANSPDSLNRIVEGTKISGEINSEGNIRIDGTVEGTISTKARLVIGLNGYVTGDIHCQEAEIEGKFNGKINVSGLLSLKGKSSIEGEANFGSLKVEEGAKLSCTCNINRKESASQSSQKQSLKTA